MTMSMMSIFLTIIAWFASRRYCLLIARKLAAPEVLNRV